MVKFMKGAVLVGAASLLLGGIASAQPTAAEFKAEAGFSKAGSKYVAALTKCAIKCYSSFWKDPMTTPVTDCSAPFGGATLTCITDSLKGANAKFIAAGVKAGATDCPECYDGGDCSATGYPLTRQQDLYNNVNIFNPLVYCKTTGAVAAEQKCQNNAAKTLSKLVGAVNKCYDKCLAGENKQTAGVGPCDVSVIAPDAALVACVNAASAKSVAGIDKLCNLAGGTPTGGSCALSYGPDGSTLTNGAAAVIAQEVPNTYCESPSGAFLE